jgi:hypothetical protein
MPSVHIIKQKEDKYFTFTVEDDSIEKVSV